MTSSRWVSCLIASGLSLTGCDRIAFVAGLPLLALAVGALTPASKRT